MKFFGKKEEDCKENKMKDGGGDYGCFILNDEENDMKVIEKKKIDKFFVVKELEKKVENEVGNKIDKKKEKLKEFKSVDLEFVKNIDEINEKILLSIGK